MEYTLQNLSLVGKKLFVDFKYDDEEYFCSVKIDKNHRHLTNDILYTLYKNTIEDKIHKILNN